MFEVLFAWLILMTTVLLMMAMEMRFMQKTRHNYLTNIAIIQLQSMVERLRANQGVSLRMREINLWNDQNQRFLPQGDGEVDCDALMGHCNIIVRWQEKKLQSLTRVL